MKALAILLLIILAGCRTPMSIVDRYQVGESVELWDGWVKNGWLASYRIDVVTVDDVPPHRRFLYDGSREGGAILISPGYHVLKLRVADGTKLSSSAQNRELRFGMTAVVGSVYHLRLEEGEVLLYRWPDIPDGQGKLEQMKKEPNKAPEPTITSVTISERRSHEFESYRKFGSRSR